MTPRTNAALATTTDTPDTTHPGRDKSRVEGAGDFSVFVVPNDKGNPPGKLADIELHFHGGIFDGLKLIGFAIWERRDGSSRNVTFPARSYSVNGERRSFALLRPRLDATAQDGVRECILDSYRQWEESAAVSEQEAM